MVFIRAWRNSLYLAETYCEIDVKKFLNRRFGSHDPSVQELVTARRDCAIFLMLLLVPLSASILPRRLGREKIELLAVY